MLELDPADLQVLIKPYSPMDLFQESKNSGNGPKVHSVTSLTRAIRSLLEGEIGPVWVEAEVFQPARPASGHVYLTLKDGASRLRAVIFRNRFRYLGFEPEEGMQVLAFGSLTVYEPRGEYQLVIDHLEPLGAGALALAFEQLKAGLSKEGLFDQDRKKPLPQMPSRVAVVTSRTGAALWDFLRVLGRRFSGLNIQVYPVLVQGDKAPAQIAVALADLAALEKPPEVIIITRGGGSLEDLAAFNTEIVARAMAACPVPIISAVGHEVDFTIADFVADLRAPTPSAAAEMLIESRVQWLERVAGLTRRLKAASLARLDRAGRSFAGLQGRLSDPKRRIIHHRLALDAQILRLERGMAGRLAGQRSQSEALCRSLTSLSPLNRLEERRQKTRSLILRLGWLAESGLARDKSRLAQMAGRLQALSPLAVLGRGYSLTMDEQGGLITDTAGLAKGDKLKVKLRLGELDCLVEKVRPDKRSI